MLAEDHRLAGVMSGIYASSRQRIENALNNNVGQRMTAELAVGLFMLFDECLRNIVVAMTPRPTAPDEAPESPGLTDPED